MNFIEHDHPKKGPVRADHRQHGVGLAVEARHHFGQRIVRAKRGGLGTWLEELLDLKPGEDLAGEFPLMRARSDRLGTCERYSGSSSDSRNASVHTQRAGNKSR